MAAALSNAPEADKKELFIEQCALNLPLHNPIYRIFQLAYLAEDIRKKRLTHMRPKKRFGTIRMRIHWHQ